MTVVKKLQLALLFPFLIACGDAASRTSAPVVRDSAGVTIVENSAPLWREGEAWRVSQEHTVNIGVIDGDPVYQLFQARAFLRLGDGRIVIGNRGSHDVRWYDEHGTFLRAAGGKGGGPGEFEDLRWIGLLPGDSVMAYDISHRRLSIFDPQGTFVRSATIQNPMLYFAHSVLDDGSVVMYRWSSTGDGVSRRFTTVIRFDDGGTLLDTIVTVSGPEVQIESRPGPNPGSIFSTSRRLMFGHDAVMAPSGSLVYVGSQDRYEIDLWDTTGTLVASVRVAGDPMPVTDDWINAFIEEAVAEADADEERRRRALFADVPHVETFPAYGRILVDPEGNLWVQDFLLPGDHRPRWTVFDPQHRMLGTVDMPQGVIVRQIGSDFVLGRWVDDLEVEHVRLYDLIKR